MAKYRRKEDAEPVRKKRNTGLDQLSLAVKLARENGMTYAQLQHAEAHGNVKIVDGKLYLKGRDY